MKYRFKNYCYILYSTLIWSIIFDIIVKDSTFRIISTLIVYIIGILIYETEFYFLKFKHIILHILVLYLIILAHNICFNTFTIINTSSLRFKTYYLVAYLFCAVFGITKSKKLLNRDNSIL